jgi:recombinational DNA repair ATPase RecF
LNTLESDLLDRLQRHPLADEEQDLLLAAMLGEVELDEAIGGTPPARPDVATGEHPADVDPDPRPPAGAYLRSITVSGFRGVGPETTLELSPGPGLTVVCGRNGSGKSSFAEALELLLTGQIRRLEGRSAVWKSTWRCLHNDSTEVSAELLLEGTRGAARVTRAWKSDANSFTDGMATVRVPGEPDAGVERLGWGPALDLYRPFLSHAELEVLLDGPSHLYDQLNNLLGLEEIAGITGRLANARKRADSVTATARSQLATIHRLLADCDDERARPAETLLMGRKVDLVAVSTLVAGDPVVDNKPVQLLRRLQSLNVPTTPAISQAVARLTAAAERLEEVGSSAASEAATTAELLSAAVAHFSKHGPGDCPVCGRTAALDDNWLAGTTAQIDRLQRQARDLREATAEAEMASREACLLVGAVPDHLGEAGTVGIDADHVAAAWQKWASVPATECHPTGLRTLAGHLTSTHPDLQNALADMREAVAAELERRRDTWTPVATALAAWVAAEQTGQEARVISARLKRIETWMKSANDELRNARLRPFAESTVELWSRLRQESNVDLVKVALTGTNTNRAVDFQVTVDGNTAPGLGVMSQGEVNALALSVFLPRATSPDSPLRFVVIDDPVQAMDPSKVDGLARVLSEVAESRQVVVFTHDDRLPIALRNLRLPARVVEVARQSESVVSLRPSRDPVTDDLDDAIRLAIGDEIPSPVTARVVPGLCRAAMEEACFEITRQRRLSRGDSHAAVEEVLSATRTLVERLALAIFDSAARGGDVYAWLDRQIGCWAPNVVKQANRGAHDSLAHPRGLVDDTRRLVDALREKLP